VTIGAWTVLGAGSALPKSGFGPSGHIFEHDAVEGVTLFDCGPGTIRALDDHGVSLAQLRRVVLTHFHVDHCLDLAALAFARRNPAAAAAALEIYAPAGIQRVLEGLEHAFGRGATFDSTTLTVLEPGRGNAGIDLGGVGLKWAANGHTSDSISIALELPGAVRVGYTGDTGPHPDLEDLMRGAELLVCECSFHDAAAVTGHLTPESAGQLAERAGVRRLLLTHFYPMLDAREARALAALAFSGTLETARDGSRHRLQDS
jgi:ribonuclease BN (tRNA processing enzyme)